MKIKFNYTAGLVLVAILLTIGLLCVEHNAPAQTQTYSIRAGQHYCDQSQYASFSEAPVYYEVNFSTNCLYNFNDKAKNHATNKLTGWTYYIDNHRDNIRLGWSMNHPRCDSIVMRLYWYSHYVTKVDPKTGKTYIPSNSKILFTAAVGNPFKVGMIPMRDKDSIIVVSNLLPKPKAFYYQFDGLPIKGYKQFFYFGGNIPAPHYMSVSLTPIPAFK